MEQNKTLLEKYFPRTWEELLLPSKIKMVLNEMLQTKGYRALLHSSPGTGKTTTARILTSDKAKNEVMYLSGSNDFNIDTLRGKVMTFASGFSVMQKQKTIIIDEFENVRDNLQDAFKIILDQCISVNFIFITNEVEKVNSAIRSRCTDLDYDFSGNDLEEQKKHFINFAIRICKEEGITYEGPGIKQLFNMNFPDFRHLLVNLQQIKDINEPVTLDVVKRFAESGKQNKELYELLENPAINGKDLYQELTKFKGKEKECLISLGEPFFQYLNDKDLHEKTLEAAMVVSKYSETYVVSINKFVTFMSCIVELKSMFK